MIKIKAEKVSPVALEPGDLFSLAGQDYWSQIDTVGSIGEKVYIRTNEPVESAPDMLTRVHRITIEHIDEDDLLAEVSGLSKHDPESAP